MKLIHTNIKKGIVKVKIENGDDLWYLSHIIDKEDIIKGKTIRKIKIGQSTDRNQKVTKKSIFVAIKVEKIEFHKDMLRVSGKINEGPDDVRLGSFHTFNVELNSMITIIKEKWLKFQLSKIKDACQDSKKKILLIVHDREEAFIVLLKKYGYEMITHIKGQVQKKSDLEKTKGNFYKDVLKKIEECEQRFNINQIILASPAFWKEDLMKENTNTDLKKKIILATCSSVDKNGIHEVLKRPEVNEALKQDRFANEIRLVDELLIQISKDNLATYGLKYVKNAADAGAVEKLLITDSLIEELREKNKYKELDDMMQQVESTKGSVIIISSENDGGKKLNGLSGIAALLRYKLNY